MPTKHIVIIGATSLIAEHCARLWAAEGDSQFTLVGRDAERLNSIAQDLRVRSPDCAPMTLVADFCDSNSISALVKQITARASVDIVLIAHGSLADQLRCQENLNENEAALRINGVSPVLFAEAFVQPMLDANGGTIAIIGSVAGDRGRKSNYVYGSAKGLVYRYAQGLQHRLAASKIRIVLIKPGPTDTPMTTHLKQQGAKLASAESVAQAIVLGVERGKPIVYAPAKWAMIMMVIRHLPAFVFNKLNI